MTENNQTAQTIITENYGLKMIDRSVIEKLHNFLIGADKELEQEISNNLMKIIEINRELILDFEREISRILMIPQEFK